MTSILENRTQEEGMFKDIYRRLEALESRFQPSSEKKPHEHFWECACLATYDEHYKIVAMPPDQPPPTPKAWKPGDDWVIVPTSEKKECCEYHEGKWPYDTTPGKIVSWCGKQKCTPESPCRKYPDCKCEIYPSELLKPCCAYHADHPQSKGKCSEDIEPTSEGKKDCAGCRNVYRHQSSCLCECHKPPDPAIEAKIEELHRRFQSETRATHMNCNDTNCDILIKCRELVELARRSER